MTNSALTLLQSRKRITDIGCDTIRWRVFVMEKQNKDVKLKSGFESTELVNNLVRRSREGDMQAMGLLYEHYKSRMFSLAYRYTYNATASEDLLQDIFIKVFSHLETLDKDEAFAGWMYRIAANTCLSYLRSHKKERYQAVSLSDLESVVGEDTRDMSEKMMKEPMEEAIQSLPTKLKSVFLLHDVQGFKHKEIAQILGCSVGTSKSQLFKARMKLRQKLEKKQLL